MITRTVSTLPLGTAFIRYMMVLSRAQGDYVEGREISRRFKDTPQVTATFDAQLSSKGAMTVGTTSDADWASPLAAYGVAGEFLQLLRSVSIVGRLEGSLRRIPTRTKVARELDVGVGSAWVQESYPIPGWDGSFDLVTQETYRLGTIVLASDELIKLGDLVAEATLRQIVIAGVSAFVDRQFLDPAVTATAAHPASVTNGVSPVTSTGSTAAQIVTDLTAMIANITTSADGLRWTMRPQTHHTILAKLAGAGAAQPPGTLFGIPVVAGSGSPAQITLIDTGAILYSDDGAVDLDVTRQATVQTLDTGSPQEIVVRSLFAENLVGMKAGRSVAWQVTRSGAVSYMTVTF